METISTERWPGEEVTISKNEYDRLVSNNYYLECLRDAGVDNWPGIDDANYMYGKWVRGEG